jgi:hypothetical protein
VIGLVGAQGVGKTTLAKKYAEFIEGVYLDASVSKIIRAAGYDPAAAGRYDFATRLQLQEIVLAGVQQLYAQAPPGLTVITDRTPLDMLGYTMAEAIGDSVPPELQDRFTCYVQACFDATNKWFSTVILVQPGIPLQESRDGKAVANPAFIEHLNSLYLGLTVDPRLECAHFYLPRLLTDLDERVQAVDNACGRTMQVLSNISGFLHSSHLVH